MAWNDGLGSGIGMAAQGAAAGAALSPAGALVGGGIGLLAGWLGGNAAAKERDARAKLIERYRQAALSGFRENQLKLIGSLEQQAAGGGPNLAGLQAQQQMARAQQAAGSLAMSGRGNAGAAMQQALGGQVAANAQISQEAVKARMEQQMRAQELLGMNITQGRQADMAANQGFLQAELGNQNNPTNADAVMAGVASAANTGLANYAQLKAQKENKARYDAMLRATGGLGGV